MVGQAQVLAFHFQKSWATACAVPPEKTSTFKRPAYILSSLPTVECNESNGWKSRLALQVTDFLQVVIQCVFCICECFIPSLVCFRGFVRSQLSHSVGNLNNLRQLKLPVAAWLGLAARGLGHETNECTDLIIFSSMTFISCFRSLRSRNFSSSSGPTSCSATVTSETVLIAPFGLRNGFSCLHPRPRGITEPLFEIRATSVKCFLIATIDVFGGKFLTMTVKSQTY